MARQQRRPLGGGGGGGNRWRQRRRRQPRRAVAGRRPGDGPQIPEIDEMMKKGQEQLRVLMGGRGVAAAAASGGGEGPKLTRGTVGLGLLGVIGLWALRQLVLHGAPEEQSVELFLGEFSSIGNPGLNFAPWPLVTAEVIPVTREQTEDIGTAGLGRRAA
jgi:membrane protease subunit HflK